MCYNPGLVRDKPLGTPAFVKLVYYGDGDDNDDVVSYNNEDDDHRHHN